MPLRMTWPRGQCGSSEGGWRAARWRHTGLGVRVRGSVLGLSPQVHNSDKRRLPLDVMVLIHQNRRMLPPSPRASPCSLRWSDGGCFEGPWETPQRDRCCDEIPHGTASTATWYISVRWSKAVLVVRDIGLDSVERLPWRRSGTPSPML